MDKQTKTIIIVATVVGLGFILVLVIFFWQPPGTVRVTVKTLPNDSTITLDGKTIKEGRQDLSKGKHTFKAGRQYFEEITEQVHTDNLKNGQTIYLLPDATSKEAIQWLRDHPDVQQQREAAGGAIADQQQQLYSQKNPIIDQLPYEAINFRVDYGASTGNQLALTVTLQPYSDPQEFPEDYKQQLKDYKAEALKFLQNNSVDTKNTSITWLPEDPDK